MFNKLYFWLIPCLPNIITFGFTPFTLTTPNITRAIFIALNKGFLAMVPFAKPTVLF